MSGLTGVVYFLVSLFFELLIFSLWIRLALRALRISTLDSFSQLIYTLTDPLVRPVRNLLKIDLKPGQKIDWLVFGILICVEIIKMMVLGQLVFNLMMPLAFLIMYVLADLILMPCNLLFYAVLILVIMSYVNPQWNTSIAHFLRLLTNPLLTPARRLIPVISGFDFSSVAVLLLLKVISLFISLSLPGRLLS